MSFRAAEGVLRAPAQLLWGELDQEFRRSLWDELFLLFENAKSGTYGLHFRPEIESAVIHVLRRVFDRTLDDAMELARVPNTLIRIIKDSILNSGYDTCLEIVQEFLRHADDPAMFMAISGVVEQPRRSMILRLWCPRALWMRGRELPRPWRTWTRPVRWVPSHLPCWPPMRSIGETGGEVLHAVESAARKLTGKPNATLADALSFMSKTSPIHPALKDAMRKLYAYSSDEDGIRHALLDKVSRFSCTSRAPPSYTTCCENPATCRSAALM
jgi:hypothetical protein